ncbi:MAG TPA: GNAT family N-acetyltransferase [bacterium]|nr:GNAT family N-acetyltransferase [bacterium]
MSTKTTHQEKTTSTVRVIGESGELKIGLLKNLGTDIILDLVEVSESLAEKFGASAKLNPSTLEKYFNFPFTYPFVAVLRGEIIGYIIGVPLERFADDLWSSYDDNLGKNNTIYTYAFAFKKRFHKTGYAKVLKKIYYTWMRKRGVEYISGHVVQGIAESFSGEVDILHQFENWHGTGETFEYYRRPLQNSQNGRM